MLSITIDKGRLMNGCYCYLYVCTIGKTYTLIGNAASGSINNSSNMPSSDRDVERGIIPRAAEHIFSKQASLDPSKVSCHIKLSILEVYQEQLKDLLRTTTNTNTTTPNTNTIQIRDTINSGLRIREQMDGIVWVENLTELCITEEVEFNRLMNTALKRRIIGTHAMNDISSRSHLCCIFNIYQVYHTTGVKINSKIHFIDLAGSEKVSLWYTFVSNCMSILYFYGIVYTCVLYV